MQADGSPIDFDSIPAEACAKVRGNCRPRFTAHPILQRLAKVVGLIALGVGCYFFCSEYLLQSVIVVGRSMAPTLADSDTYLLNRWIYRFRAPKPAEIIVLRDPVDAGFSVKRVVAGPGDKVFLKAGRLYVNGKTLSEPYLAPSTVTFADQSTASFECHEDEFFVLGDNRNNSVDSRTYGPVPRRNILGLIIR